MQRFAFIFAFFVFTGCAHEPWGPIDASAPRTGHVYLFRGFIGLVASGVDQFKHELRAAGFDARTYSDMLDEVVAARIEREYARSTTHEPLILIGYSTGAPTAVAVARRLNRSHIPVDILVTIDPPRHAVASGNVRWCINYYERTMPGLLLFSGTLMEAEPSVKVDNIQVKTANHFNIDQSEELHADLMARMAAICPRRDAGGLVSVADHR